MGGLWAVMVTDILQFVILTAAVFILLPLSLAKVGGFEKFTQSGSSSHLVKVGVSHQDDSFAEQLKTRSSIHLTLDIFEPVYLPLYLAVAPFRGESLENGFK
jgi:Na+/proline symporter